MLHLHRQSAALSQAQMAGMLGVTQAYYSMLEAGKRPLTPALATRLATVFRDPRLLPLDDTLQLSPDQLADGLAALGYPGYAHRQNQNELHNPASLLLAALTARPLEARLVEGFTWLLVRYPDLDWDWLVPHAKLRDLQNRLGFLAALARSVAEPYPQHAAAVPKLLAVEQRLEPSRLAREDWFGALTNAEKRWLRQDRPAMAAAWNMLADFKPADVRYVNR